MYINGVLALARCETALHYWKGDRFFKFHKEDPEDSQYWPESISIEAEKVEYFNKYQASTFNKGFQYYDSTSVS